MRIANTLEYDLLFASSTPLTVALPGISARILRRKPFVFEVRDLWPDLPRALGVRNHLVLFGMKCLERSAYAAASGCIGLSPGIVEGIRDRSRKGKPIEMIPNCSDLDLFLPGRREDLSVPGIDPGDFVAAFTGAHGVANGLGTVVDAASVLKQRGNESLKILFVGDGSEKPMLVETAHTRQLTNCIFLDPVPREKLARLIGSVDCGLMILKNVPAFYRGTSPNKFFDYISAGLPVVNNYPGWLAEMILDSECGAVVRPDDPADLADTLEMLQSDAAECQRMGAKSRLLAEARFSRADHADRFVRLLENVHAGC
jgi:glycosyltransferase involved in cell wall biosynthesis